MSWVEVKCEDIWAHLKPSINHPIVNLTKWVWCINELKITDLTSWWWWWWWGVINMQILLVPQSLDLLESCTFSGLKTGVSCGFMSYLHWSWGGNEICKNSREKIWGRRFFTFYITDCIPPVWFLTCMVWRCHYHRSLSLVSEPIDFLTHSPVTPEAMTLSLTTLTNRWSALQHFCRSLSPPILPYNTAFGEEKFECYSWSLLPNALI